MIIVYYGKDINLQADIQEAMCTLNIPYLEIGDDCLHVKLKDIQQSSSNLYGTHALFMYFIEEEYETVKKLSSLLDFSVPRKAMQNENNKNWTLLALMEEIEQEVEYFQVREYLYTLIQKADVKRMETDEEYARLMAASYGLIEQEEASIDLLKFAIECIEKKAPQ